MGKIEVLNLVFTKLDIELGLAQPQLVLSTNQPTYLFTHPTIANIARMGKNNSG